MELDVVRRPVVCPRLSVQPEHVTLVLSCGAGGGNQEMLGPVWTLLDVVGQGVQPDHRRAAELLIVTPAQHTRVTCHGVRVMISAADD